MLTLCIVPARGGSKGVPKKNLRIVDGHPLLAWSVIAGKSSQGIDRTIISTDSPEIAEVAKSYGAEAPFLRPADLSGDRSTDLEYVLHALDWFESQENWIPDFVIQLRPTTPTRDPELVSKALRKLEATPSATGLRSAHELDEPPQKQFQIINGIFEGFFPEDPRPEYFNLPRQSFPKAYSPNGYVDIIRVTTVRQSGKLYGDRILAWITPVVPEVDTEENLAFLEWKLERSGNPLRSFLNR